MKRWLEQIISIPLWFMIFPFISVLTHWEMVRKDTKVKKLKRATYAEIKQKMFSIDWRYDWRYPNSLFDKNDYDANYFHADIFRFGDVGYLLTPYGYLMAKSLQRKIRRSLSDYTPTRKPYVN